MVFWRESTADKHFNDAVFEIFRIAPRLRTGSSATMIGSSTLKFPHYLRVADPNTEASNGTFIASHYDALWSAAIIPWENEVLHPWNKNTVNDPTIYDAILTAPSTPKLLAYSSMRDVRLMNPDDPRQIIYHNDLADPGLTSIFGTRTLYSYDPNLIDPNIINIPALDPNRNTWLLTKDGITPAAMDATDQSLIRILNLPDRFAMDWGIKACRDWIIEQTVDLVVDGHGGHEYDGHSADNVSIGASMPLRYSSIDPTKVADPNDPNDPNDPATTYWNWKYKTKEAEWQQAGIALIRGLRDALHAHGRVLSTNTDLNYHNDPKNSFDVYADYNPAGDEWAWNQVLYGDNGMPIVDQLVTEIPIKGKDKLTGSNDSTDFLLGADWERAMKRHEEVIEAGVVDWWLVYPVNYDLSWRNRAFLYHYASFLLVAQPGHSLFYATLYANSVSNQTVWPWYDLYDLDLGDPRGARVTDPNQGFCYRFYDNAVVIVNPTTATVTASLTDTSVTPSVQYRPVSLSSGRGLVLPRYDVTKVGTDPNDPNNQKVYSGPGAIQAAINQASDGDTLFISPGVYQEQLDIGGKNIVLTSLAPEDPNIVASTIIYPLLSDPNDPNNYGPALTLGGTENAYDMTTRKGCRIMGLFLVTTNPSGAAVVGNGSSASLEHCIVQNDGGDGISDLDGLIAHCKVSNNHGHGMTSCDGSILYCTINGNGGDGINGGGVGSYVHNCYIQNNSRGISGHAGTITNCLITGNHTSTVGAGLSDCNVTLANCTIADNVADNTTSIPFAAAGLYNVTGKIVHCIIWDNYIGGTVADLNAVNSPPTYSCFEPNSIDPGYRSLFTDANNNNVLVNPNLNAYYRLDSGSPCIDAGSTDPDDIYGIEDYKYLYDTLDGNFDNYNPRYKHVDSQRVPGRLASMMVDLANNPRVDDKGAKGVHTGNFNNSVMTDYIDIGAFEHTGANYTGDCDADGLPDYREADLDNNGIPDDCDPNLVDCNGNGIPDALDLDLDNNGQVDSCEIAADPNLDLNLNGIIDTYETVLYVDGSTVGGRGDGSSWVHAFTDLQDALAYTATRVYVTEIWVAAGTYTADLNTAFEPISGVDLYGGFVGNELDRSERDHAANVTILSGLGTNYPVVRIFNKHNVVIDGFTIRDGDYSAKGAGAEIGAGSTNITFANCLIRDNQSAQQAGGVYVTGASSGILLEGCVLSGNSATSSSVTTYGGALGVATNSSATIKRCIIVGNSADAGGALRVSPTSTVTCSDSLFSWNSATWAGAIHTTGQLDLNNCTVSRNAATSSIRTIWVYDGHLDVVNSIIYGNTGSGAAALTLESGATATVTYSDIEGGWVGAGNIDIDPEFRDPDGPDNQGGTSDDDFTLNTFPWSPCIDAGNNTPVSSSTDLAGNPRIDDDAAIVDLGAYERQP